MDVLKFQEMLNDICALAQKNKSLTIEQVRDFFSEAELSQGQLLKVLQYLKVKNIKIEGLDELAEAEKVPEEENVHKSIPLTPEEEIYLQEYLAGLAGEDDNFQTSEALFEALADGKTFAREELANRYLRKAAELAAEKNCEEIYLADLIQEANISLLTALDNVQTRGLQEYRMNENWLLEQIRAGLDEAIRVQTERKFADDCLVAKVEKLEEAVRDLSEDEEGQETKFSIDELAIILDMDAEEIRDVLRLTGDDK